MHLSHVTNLKKSLQNMCNMIMDFGADYPLSEYALSIASFFEYLAALFFMVSVFVWTLSFEVLFLCRLVAVFRTHYTSNFLLLF